MEVLTESEILNSPSRIYNMEETGKLLDGHTPWVIAKQGKKTVRYRTTENKNKVTVIACVNTMQWIVYSIIGNF